MRTPFVFGIVVCSIAIAFLSKVHSQEPIQLRAFPATVELSGREARANVIVQLSQANTSEVVGAQVTEDLQFQVVDSKVATIENGRVSPVSDGQTELIVRANGAEVRVPVVVQDVNSETAWEFNAHIQSVMTRAGCNSGACHGALAGKGGFRLSLRGYDSLADHYSMTRQDHGRRIEPNDPGLSLLLAKPSMLMNHKGGLRLEEGSRDYRILAEWIAAGAVGPLPGDAELEKLEILPGAIELSVGKRQQLIVQARYRNGRVEDVTHWAKFSASNESVARVNEFGQVDVIGNGKGAIVALFSGRVAIASLIVPYENQVNEVAYQDFSPQNLIDEILLDEWRALRLTPSSRCDDSTFLRRVYLDTTGRLPTETQVRAFVGDPSPDRRSRLIDELLSSEGYVDYWSYKWSDLLLVNGTLLRPDAVAAFYKWIRSNVEQNTPWDEFCRQIVVARGESLTDGATNFYAIHQDPESLTENTCQAFMGLSIGCAKCHNHPLEKWTNDQYYAMANLYSRVRAKGWGGDSRNGDGQRTLMVLERGDLIQPSRGKPQPPAPLDAEPIDMNSPDDRRVHLANWLIRDDNQYFSRSIVNRVWANFMGVGLVESVDDLRVSNPPSSERLLAQLAQFVRENRYDLKALMRLILKSETYQRSAEATPGNADDLRFYCRYYPRRLMAEVLHDAVVQVTEVPSKFTEIEFPGSDKTATKAYPEGTSSLELSDSAVANYFLKTFGRHQRRITCECERSDQPTVIQALHLNNGTTLNEKLSDKQCVISRWIDNRVAIESVIEEAYLRSLSRLPSAAERKKVGSVIAENDLAQVSRRESLEDLLWSLMTSREFLFAH